MSTDPYRLSKYEQLVRLGQGGMAEVWKAFDTQLQRHVAIKILHANLQNDPNFMARFEREAQLIASLHHPNIVQIYDFHISRGSETEETSAYMVMDYIEGITLAQYLQRTSRAGRFPSPADIVHLFTPICQAVDYAHQKGIIHCDLKPANILLDRRNSIQGEIGEPILSDFGIAKLLEGTSNLPHDRWLGTPHYTSPEQAKGETGDERSDIYSLSIILYETCVGTLPFQGETPAAIIEQQINANPIAPVLINPTITPAITAAILRGLAKSPSDRFPSASSMGIAIAEALAVPVPPALRQSAHQASMTRDETIISPLNSRILHTPSSPALTPTPLPQSGANFPALTPVITSPSGSFPFRTASPPVKNTSLGELAAHTSRTPNTGESGVQSPSSPNAEMDFAQSTDPGNANINSRTLFPFRKSAKLPAMPARPNAAPAPPAFPRQFLPQLSPQRRTLIIALIILLLISASMSTLFLLTRSSSKATSTASVGNAFFINSGQLNTTNSQGINDEVEVDLHNIPDPPSGKAYYAWLLADKLQSEGVVTPLGQLHAASGNIHFLYKGDAQHTNLLAIRSRILITQEDASVTPSTYSPDYTNWLYYAQISQAASPKDATHFNLLDHIRHLLSNAPEPQAYGLYGGLDMWFLRNTQKVMEWSNAARDNWRNGPDLLHRNIIRILDYLDGASYVAKDIPAGSPVMLADLQSSQIALLDLPPGSNSGYVYLVSTHLNGAVLSPDATNEQRDLASRVQVAIDETRVSLQQMHQDATQLVVMSPDQLGQPEALSLLDDLVTNALAAFVGKTDPLTGQLQGGVTWICSNIQRMADFNMRPFNPQTDKL